MLKKNEKKKKKIPNPEGKKVDTFWVRREEVLQIKLFIRRRRIFTSLLHFRFHFRFFDRLGCVDVFVLFCFVLFCVWSFCQKQNLSPSAIKKHPKKTFSKHIFLKRNVLRMFFDGRWRRVLFKTFFGFLQQLEVLFLIIKTMKQQGQPLENQDQFHSNL